MNNIIDILRSVDDFSAGKGASKKLIDAASNTLGLTFSEDYKQYLQQFGLAYVNGHELTGIGIIPRNDVVSVTLEKRKLPHVSEIPDDWYVIEDTYIDGIVIWQATNGFIYMESPGTIKKICSSMSEYIMEC